MYLVLSPSDCGVIEILLTHVAAKVFGASDGPAHGGVSVFHQRVLSRTIEARADRVAALGLRAHALPTLIVSSGGDQSGTIRALDGVAVDRV